MGTSHYSADLHSATMKRSADLGEDYMMHTSAIASGTIAAAVHDSLSPKKRNKLGHIIRESRDSDAHPDSRAVAVIFDMTGSMGAFPRAMMEKLGGLMKLIVSKGYLPHPHVLFGCYGDASQRETAPIQVGQFEGGNEMDAALANFYLEGAGGGNHNLESPELILWFLNEYCKMDCLEKRGEKGLLFIIGDEIMHTSVKTSEIKEYIGDENLPQSNIRFSKLDPRPDKLDGQGDLLESLREKFDIFWLIPNVGWGSSTYSEMGSPESVGPLTAMFGQSLIRLEKAEEVADLIAATIGVHEGIDIHDVKRDLVAAGSSKASAESATSALAKYVSTTAVTKGAAVSGDLAVGVGAGSDRV